MVTKHSSTLEKHSTSEETEMRCASGKEVPCLETRSHHPPRTELPLDVIMMWIDMLFPGQGSEVEAVGLHSGESWKLELLKWEAGRVPEQK